MRGGQDYNWLSIFESVIRGEWRTGGARVGKVDLRLWNASVWRVNAEKPTRPSARISMRLRRAA